MFKWNSNRKVRQFFGQLKELRSKASAISSVCLSVCRDAGLDTEALEADVKIIGDSLASFESRVRDGIPEYILDGGCARLIETRSLLEAFQDQRLKLGTTKDAKAEKERMSEAISSIHLSVGKLVALKREIENGVGDEYKKKNWWGVCGGLLVASGIVAEIVVWLVCYNGCEVVGYYWKMWMALLALVSGLAMLLKSRRDFVYNVSGIGCPYEPKSEEQKNLVRSLKSYCLSSEIDYANMIDGPWGAGKTFFINTVMRPALRNCGKELFYVSLNGVSGFDDVVKQVVFGQELADVDAVKQTCVASLCEKYMSREAARYVLSNWRGLFWRRKDGAGYVKSRLGDFLPDRSVVFVDDVERVEQPELLKHLMGKLHEEFVCKGYHVVYAGDQSEIKSLDDFNKVKEKYIRHTYPFALDVSAVVDMFVAAYPSGSKERRRAVLCSELLKEFAIHFKVQNARTVKRILDDFVFLANLIGDEELLGKVRGVLFGRIAPVVTEVSKGSLNVFDRATVESLKDIEVEVSAMRTERLFASSVSRIATDDEKKEKRASPVRELISRYGLDQNFGWKLEDAIASYVLFGSYDETKVRNAAEGWRPMFADKYVVALHAIWGRYTLEDDEFSDNCLIVEEGLKVGKYNAENVKLACELLYAFVKEGWLKIDAEAVIEESARALRERWKKLPKDDINPMILHNEQEEFLKPIIDAIRDEQMKRSRERSVGDVETFLKALATNDKVTAWSFFPQGVTWRIFDEVVMADKSREFCGLPNQALYLVAMNIKESGVFIRPDSCKAIKRIVEEIDSAIASCDRTKPIRRDVLNQLKEKFSEILCKPEFQRVASLS